MVRSRCIIFRHRSYRTLLLTYVSSPRCLNISVFLVSSTRFIRSDDSGIFVRLARPQPSRPYNTPAGHISITPVGSPLFRSLRFTTVLCTYSENPIRLISSRTSHSVPPSRSPDPIYPPDSNLDECGLPHEKSSPLFGCFSGGCLWLGRIDHVRLPSSCPFPASLVAVREPVPYSSSTLRFPLPRYLKAAFPGEAFPSTFYFLSNGRHIFFHTACYADFVAAPFSGPSNPSKVRFAPPHSNPQMLFPYAVTFLFSPFYDPITF